MGTATHQIERAQDGALSHAFLQWRHVLVLVCLACAPMSCEDSTSLDSSGDERDTSMDTSPARSDVAVSVASDVSVDSAEPADTSRRQEVSPDTSSLAIEVSIEPLQPTTLDSLKVTVVLSSGAAAPELRYTWRRDGVLTANTGSTLPASQTARGHTWEVTVRGENDVPVGSSGVTIQNTPPVCLESAWTNTSPTSLDSVECVCASWDDPDQDTVTAKCLIGLDAKPSDNVTPGSCTVHPGTPKGTELVCSVIPYDGIESGPATTEVTATVINSPPYSPIVSLVPTQANISTELHCKVLPTADPDGDPLNTLVEWFVDDQAVGVQTEWIIAGELPGVTVGSNISCTGRTFDGEFESAPGNSIEVTVGNSAPSGGQVTISPATATEASVLTCMAQNANDPDGDAITWNYKWIVNGALTGVTSDSLGGEHFDRGNTVSCAARPSDGLLDGDWVTAGLAVVIQNSPPSIELVSLSPQVVFKSDVLTCLADGILDVDPQDVVTLTYQWTVDGEELVGAEADTLDPFALPPDVDVKCLVTPSDGIDDGVAASSAPVQVQNTLPTAWVTVAPGVPDTMSSLTCQLVDATDAPDDEPLTFSWGWERNGEPYPWLEQELPASVTSAGDQWRCTVVPSDPWGSGDVSVSDWVKVENSPPTVGSVSISPQSATGLTELTCHIDGVFDVDGDTLDIAIEWFASDTPVGDGTTTFVPFGLPNGTAVTCRVVVTDTAFNAFELVSAPATVVNKPPSITGVDITPLEANTASTLTCSAQGWSDPDGDSPAYEWNWFVNGAKVNHEAAVLGPQWFAKGDLVVCRPVPLDDYNAGVGISSAPLTILNSPPSATAEIQPSNPTSNTDISCAADWLDPDVTDMPAYTFSWVVDGVTLEDQTETTLESTFFGRDNTVYCIAVPFDGEASGAPANSSPVVISNAAPSLPNVLLAPPDTGTLIDLECVPIGYTDPDGDSANYVFTWFLDDVLLEGEVNAALSSANFSEGQSVRCEIFATDGEGGTTETLSTTPTSIGNTPPSVQSVLVNPMSGGSQVERYCEAVGLADPDAQDTPSVLVEWLLNGEAIPGEIGSVVTPLGAVPGSQLLCRITPTDGEGLGLPVESPPVFIDNTPPTLVSASVVPIHPTTTTELTCTADGAEDIDGQSVAVTLEWLIDGEVIGLGSVLSPDLTTRGDTLTCRATPSDGASDGAAVIATPVTVVNSLPIVGAVQMTPLSPTEVSGAECTASQVQDADTDIVDLSWTWEIDGDVVPELVSPALPAGAIQKGQVIQCSVTPGDGFGAGPTATGPIVTVGNAAPSATQALISPEIPVTHDDIFCSGVGFTDPDGDPEGYRYSWLIGGLLLPDISSDVLPSANTAKGQSIQCKVSPWDGASEGASVLSNVVVVANSAPTAPIPSVAPAVANVNTLLTCETEGGQDPDSDVVTLTYAWSINDNIVLDANHTTFVPTLAVRGDAIRCHVTPNDGVLNGGASISPAVILQNAPPEVVSLSISPMGPTANDQLSCEASVVDPDSDPVEIEYRWIRDSLELGTGSTLSNGFVRNDEIVCEASPKDAESVGQPSQVSVIIDNAPPTLESLDIVPNVPTAATGATCVSGTTSDVDGDTVNTSIQWFIDDQIGPTTPAIDVLKGQLVRCVMTPTDGVDNGVSQEATAMVGNTVPTASGAQLLPVTAVTTDELTCSGLGFSDIDGEPEGWQYQWLEDGQILPGENQPTLSAERTSRDKTYRCDASPYDGESTGLSQSSNDIMVANTAPMLGSVIIEPSSPNTTTDLVCTPNAALDADDDSITYLVTWRKNGQAFPWFDTVLPAAAHTRGMTFSCELTPTDGTSDGLPQHSPDVVIGNAPPQFDSHIVTPSDPSTCSTINCAVTSSDPDPSDTVQTTISWFIDDQPAGNGETLELSSASPGASVSCSATAIDGEGATNEQSVAVTVQNIPPVVGLVTLNPAAPEPGTVIHCEGELWSDDCNILPKYDFAWYVNGSQLSGAETTTISTATLPVGSDVYCVITPFDGLDQGIPVASNEVTIGCVAGSCDDEDSCTDDSCNPLTGLCEQVPIDCSDGDPCTNDQCDGGICSHPPTDCGDGDPCTIDSCGEFGCTSIPKDCADNDPCTTDVCEPSSGVCHQTVVSCDDQDPCTSDYCDPTASVDEQCKHLPIAPGVCGSLCEQPSDCGDGNPCTLDGCGSDGCTNEPPDCDDGESCTVDTCDPLSGECTHEILPNCFVGCTQDSHCDDGKVCTTDVCTLGQCESTADPSCVPCSGLTDCANENLCVVMLCELGEGQIEGECTTSSRTCYDGVNCTFDTCDPNVGCVFKTLAGCEVGCDDDADCDDGNLCTDDVCELDESACSNTLIACNDGDPCTLDACTPDTGTCASLPWPACDDEGGDCAEDTKCQSAGNACLSGYCAGPDDDKRCIFEPVLCNDTNSCTTDVCESEGAGCVFIQESPECTPGDCETAADCGVGDLCAIAACVDGLCAPTCIDDYDCDDSDANTLDSCLSDGRCIHVPGVPCSFDADCWDENACTRETCDMGTCRSRPVQCDDGSVCTKALAPCAGEPDAITTARALLGCNTAIGQVPACDPTAGCYRLPALNCGQSWIPGEEPLQYECTDDADCSTDQLCQPGSCIDGYCTVEIIQCAPSGPDVMAYCNPANGACEEVPQPGWAGCDEDSDCRFVDGFPDVGLDHCSLGYCDVHALEPGCFFVQRHCDDQNPCTQDSCDPAIGCVFAPMSDCNGCSTAAECDDLNDCTVDACDNFQCVYDQVEGCEPCQNYTCNVVGGEFECSCLATAVFQCPIPYCQSDAECSDGLTCTLDQCLPTGACVHTPVDCVFDSGCVFSAGECLEGFGCVSLADAECTQDCETALDCETKDLCAPADCISGSCSVQPVVCDDSDPCTTDLCMPTTGSCVFVASPGCASQLCDTSDANACAYVGSPECTPAACIDDTCTLVSVACDDHNPCTTDTCDALTGQCAFSHIVDCTGCVSAANCSDGNACTLDSCTDGTCDFTLIDDCLPCVADTDCPISGDACAPISCDGLTSKCVTTVMPDCEVCDATETLLGQAEQCNDGNDCTVDSCDDTTNMCVHLPDEALPGCAPVFCESSWTCAQESDCRVVFCDFTLAEPACDHNAADVTLFPECPVSCSVDLDCFDDDPCTLDRCNGLTQTCDWYAKDCVDSLACTTDHVCTSAGCQFTTNAECSTSCVDSSDCATDDPCFTGACIPDGSGGTRCEVQIMACEDGDIGTFDWCAAGVCQSAVLPDGGVANACVQADDCRVLYGSALGLPSDCTTFQCIDGFCASAPVVCNDSNPCTEDSCDPSAGCEFMVQPGCLLGCTVDADCDDDDVLTQDVCSDNACRNYFGGVPCTTDIECKDDNACTYEYCNSQNRCEGRPILCWDGLDCTKDLAPCGAHPADISSETTYPDWCDPENGQPVACDPAAGCYQMPLETCGDGNSGVTCTSNLDCSTEQLCWPSICGPDGVCISGPSVCTASGPDKMPYCEPTSGQCQENDADGWIQCADHDDCRFIEDDFLAGRDRCEIAFCNKSSTDPLTRQCMFIQRHCDDLNPCTLDTCEPEQGCVFKPIDGCLGCSSDTECDDWSPCTVDSCDSSTNRCQHIAIPGCKRCTVGTAQVLCNDGNDCTKDMCDESLAPQTNTAGACVHVPYTQDEKPGCFLPCAADIDCTDDDPCTIDRCDPDALICTHDKPTCIDGNPCTDDPPGCVLEFPGCQYNLSSTCGGQACQSNTECDAGNLCITGTCAQGNCEFDPVLCDDFDPGTRDTCDPFTGQCLFTPDPTGGPATCEPTPFGVPAPGCNDDNPCTIDICVGTEGLMCFYVAVSCDDFDPCTSDACDPTGVGCEFTPIADCLGCSDDADCDDGNACTVDLCEASQCESELPPFGAPPLYPECTEEP